MLSEADQRNRDYYELAEVLRDELEAVWEAGREAEQEDAKKIAKV